jgi:predicted nucleic acid-binding Zn ribbon protein
VRALNSSLSVVVRSLLDRSPMSDGKFDFAWRTVVGPAMQRVTRAAIQADGTVRVSVEDAAWRREVKRAQPAILAELQQLLGDSIVKRLKIVGGDR